MPKLTNEQLLAEVEDILRTMPPRATIRHEIPENYAWLGRAAALVSEWNTAKAIAFDGLVSTVHATRAIDAGQAVNGIMTMLHQVRHSLRLNTVGPLSVAVSQGAVFDYFDELRKVIEGAKLDLLFVDPFLDAEFASRYLPNITSGVFVRLLGRDRMSTLLPAVHLLRQQTGLTIEVRSSTALHDRFVFIDKSMCFQSGASFKDGAKKSPTTLTQISDAFPAMQSTYESLWVAGTPQV
ncbi:MAG: hypothetical protein HZB47_04255 [Nitrosomonadales bacterium]|nr:hypothetical protein [Nitrosomonadales bacterium]